MAHKLALRIREAAALLGLSPWTLRKMIAQGKLATVRLNRRVLVEPAELRRLVEEGRTCRKEESRPATGGKGI